MMKNLLYEVTPEGRESIENIVPPARAEMRRFRQGYAAAKYFHGCLKVFWCAFLVVFFALPPAAAEQNQAKVEDKAAPEKTSPRALSPAERQWLKTHQTLRVGFFDNYMPYSGTDRKGQVTGIVKDIFPDILARLGISDLKVAYTGYKSYDAMIVDLKAGRIDVAFPVGGRSSIVKGNDISRSVPVTSTSTVLVYKGAFTEGTMAHFAINKDNRMQRNFIIKLFPKSKVTKYPSIDACLDAVVSGEVSSTSLNGLRANHFLKNRKYRGLSLHQLDSNDDRYCGVGPGNEGLRMLLDRGLGALGKDYAHNKSHRYAYAAYAHQLEVEKQWLKTHNALRVGFFENYMPYSGTDKDGRVTGIVRDIIPDILASQGVSNLKVTYSGYASYDAMIADLLAGRIDVAFPVGGRASVGKGNDILRSDPVTSTSTVLVYKGTFTEGSMAHFAINKDNRMQYNFIVKLFPRAEVTEYPSIDACLDAVVSGEVSCTTLNGMRANHILKNRKYRNLSLHQLGRNDDRYFGVGPGNEGLLMLLDRGLDALGKDYAHNKSNRFSYAPSAYRLEDVFLDNLWLFGSSLFAVASVIIGLLVRDIRRTKHRMAEKEAVRARLEETNRKLTEHAETIEKQRRQETELRRELEKKQAELDAALQKAQAAYNEKTTVLTDLEDASGLARLASFHYDFDTRIRTGSKLVGELWPVDENGQALLEEDFVYPEDIPVFKQNVGALLEKKSETVQFSFRVGSSPDALRHYRMKLSLDPHKPNAVTGIVQDVTELAESMLKLKDAQTLWNTAINSIPIMFTVKDIDDGCRYLLGNNAFADLCGRPPDEVAGKSDPELFDNAETLDFADRMNRLARTMNVDEMKDLEGDLPLADGSICSIRTVMRVIHDTSGHRLLLAATSDVTEERNKREELSRAMTSLENASRMARLAWFRYELRSHRRTGSKLLYSIWPEDENGVPIRFEEWVHPDDIPIFARDLQEIEHSRKPGETSTFSFRIGKAPNLRYIRALTSLDMSDPDEPAVVGILQDVTELAESMLKLKDTQALWNTAINSIPIMFTVKDIDDGFRYLLCNKSFAETFNITPDEIVGKTDRDIFHDDTTIGFADRINIPTTGTDGLMEIEGEVPDGHGNLRYIKTLMRVFKDARGHRLLLAAANDVTDMHRLLQNRGVINELLEDIIGEEDFDLSIGRTLETVCKILGASRSCLIRHEEAGNKAHCVAEYVEPTHAHASFRMLGRTLSRVRGILENTVDQRTFVCDDIGSIDWNIVKEDWHQAALALDLRAIFLSNIVCDGEVRGTVAFNFEGIDHTFSDYDVSLLRVTTHIIEVVLARRHAQTLIMDALAHAQAADKAKSFFIASVSHEIRTPLNSVIGFAELLREGGVSQKQEKEYLDAISTSANALLMLINDVLDLSKLEANQMRIVTAFTDLNALCREVMLIFTFRARENGNQLVSDVPEDLPELDVDNIRIRQILINLFGNAVKFTKDGTITLHVSFDPDPGADTGTLRCAVSDTGIGISEENQKKLMEPFVQLSGMRGTNAVNNGTGLGLSISKRLAVCMNGELTCASKVGEGSTFAVTLRSVRYRAKTAVPAVREHSDPKPAALARDLKSTRILIVDDVPLNLHVAKALFDRIGFDEVYTVESGRAALELLGKQPIDLILSDIWMPEMSGSEFSAEVKKDPRFANIPIVAQTADVETNGNFDMSHFDAVILKPLTKEKLANMVKRIIGDGDLRKGDGGAPVNLG